MVEPSPVEARETIGKSRAIREGAQNDAQNDPKHAETRSKLAEMGPMLREFWFEWGPFLPQLICRKAVAIMGAINHIQSESA
jgi:hypothetical protein